MTKYRQPSKKEIINFLDRVELWNKYKENGSFKDSIIIKVLRQMFLRVSS